jgi:hypothetical protein
MCEIIVDSDSAVAEYSVSGMKDEEVEPRPLSRESSRSQCPSSPDFCASSFEDKDAVENVAIQQPQSIQ